MTTKEKESNNIELRPKIWNTDAGAREERRKKGKF